MVKFCIENFYNNLKQIDIFNFIRGIALLCVIGIHTVCVINPVYPDIHYSKFFNTPAWMAMWIFFFLSGYLLGKGFYSGKYRTDRIGILGFYISRLIRIVPMYFLFLFIIFLFYNPIWFITNPITILKLLTFTYNGSPGINGIGATWFVSEIVQLYILAPLFYKFIFSKINNKNQKLMLFSIVLIVLLGLSYRLLINLFKLPYWENCMTLSLGNIDLFFGGMLLNTLTINSNDNKIRQILRPLALFSLFLLIFLAIFKAINTWLYHWICPTLILISMLLVAYSFDFQNKPSPAKLTIKSIIKNPLRFIEYIGIISFSFYLYHSNLIEISMKILKDENFPICIPDIYLYRCTYILMFLLTFILSVIMHYILEEPCNNIRNNLLGKIYNKQ